MYCKALVTIAGCAGVAYSVPHSSAHALDSRQTGPVALLQNGTVLGSTTNGIDNFQGIPFAASPVGPLRLKAPQSYAQKYPGGIFDATSLPLRCTQQADNPTAPNSNPDGEDCLTITIQRPTGTAAGADLPVVFYIFGGGFESGSNSDYDATQLLTAGVSGPAAGHPFIYVVPNYRLGAFGFLAGKQVQADGSTNLGLRDQRLALEWVAENIAAFGGDPSKVTIWGESAGAISVFDQLVINGGVNTYNGKPLFRGAILNSGSAIPANTVTTKKAQDVYNEIANLTGCANATDSLSCIRDVDYDTLNAAQRSIPNLYGYRSLDLAFEPRPDPTSDFFSVSPDVSLNRGAYVKVPTIIGDCEDEGTFFALPQTNLTDTADVVAYLQTYYLGPANASVPALVATYPDDPAAGSPFGTGDANNIYPEFKRLAAILGDIVFTLTRRIVLTRLSSAVTSWSFLDSHLQGLATFGTAHTTDLTEIYQSSPYPNVGAAYQTYYTSFINFLDPNKIATNGTTINWPQYTTANPTLLQLNAANLTTIPDTFRATQYGFLQANFGLFKV